MPDLEVALAPGGSDLSPRRCTGMVQGEHPAVHGERVVGSVARGRCGDARVWLRVGAVCSWGLADSFGPLVSGKFHFDSSPCVI